jgi:hypothetical protein
MVKNFVFIDNRIGNYKTLVAGLSDDTVWVLLNADKDGIQQMMETSIVLFEPRFDSAHFARKCGNTLCRLDGTENWNGW